LILDYRAPGLFAFAGQCWAQGRKEKTGGEASGGYWNYLGCDSKK